MSIDISSTAACDEQVADVPASAEMPRKVDLFGVNVSVADSQRTLALIMAWARERRPSLVDFVGVQGLTIAQQDPDYKRRLNNFDLVVCDGQPVRWVLNRWYGAGIPERVYGPALTLEVCRAAAMGNVPIYFYGSSPEVLDRLTTRMLAKFPKLNIVGAEAPPFRPLTDQEREETIARINDSGAGVVFIGLGCPKQARFATDVQGRINAVQMCVGAAFDFHAGTLQMAPRWMQKAGLEWLYRVYREPRRLWKRYLVRNTQFVGMCLTRMLLGTRSDRGEAASS